MLKNVLLVVALVNSTLAVGADKSITVLGPSSCMEWIEAKRAESVDSEPKLKWVAVSMKRAWVLGYVSALNASHKSNKDLLAAVNSTVVEAWVDKYCNENPKKRVYDAADKLLLELVKISR